VASSADCFSLARHTSSSKLHPNSEVILTAIAVEGDGFRSIGRVIFDRRIRDVEQIEHQGRAST